jgi:LysM repeat protein
MSIHSLKTAFAAATWPVTLNAEFITSGGEVPPGDFDALLKTAFVLSDPVGLAIGQGSVGEVIVDSFTITGASLVNGLFGAAATDTVVTLTFTLPDTAGAVLLVQIDTAMGGDWTFATGFPAMVGNPFNQLIFTQSNMVFASAKSVISWPTASGSTVALTPGMNFAGVFVPGVYASSVLVIANLSGAAIPNPLVMSGPFDASVVSDTVIFPVMDLAALLMAASFTFLGFTSANPYFGFSVSPMPESDGSDDDQPEQTVSSIFGATLTTETTPALALDFSVLITGGNSYTMLLAPPEDDTTPLTPANIATIAGVSQNFIAAVPAPLQSFFTSIAFQGINLCAMLPSGQSIPTISATGVSVGTVENFNYVLIADPTGGCSVTITSLDLNWTVLNPTGSATQMLLFTTTFTMLPNVFTDMDGNPGGEFTLTIDQDFTISALFGGQVSLANLLPAVTAGLVQLPSGISVIFSNVQLLIDTSAKTYAFSLDVDLAVDIITWNGQPLLQLQGMTLALSASTPQTTGAQTTYAASMAGLMVVGPVGLNVDISYDGAASPPQWNLTTSLAAALDLGTLLSQLFAVTDLDTFLPDFLPKTLTVNTFTVTAMIPGGTAKSSYTVAATLDWTTDALLGLPIACSADLALAYDGSQFTGSVLGTIEAASISGLELTIGYAFNQPDTQGATILMVQWQGVTGIYHSIDQTITLTLNGWSFGSLVTSLVAMTGNPYFTLTGPWTFLNSIPLDGLALTFNLKSEAKTTVSVSYSLSSPISLGFITIEALNFNRDPKTGKVLLSITGSSPLSSTDQDWKSLFSPDPTQGQDVTKMPAVPGRGNALFDVRLLALGQHVSFNTDDMNSVADVINALENIPPTISGGGGNPVDPNSTQTGKPRYDAQSNWLVAANLGLLGVKTGDSYTYTVDVEVVFNDPGLYGLRLSFNGAKAKVLDGLVIDIMYKKVSVTIGVYQLDFTFPNSLRQLNFGAVNVTLPSISIQIYTNGDFMFDLGFPYNLDFSRSFTLQGFVGPFPVMGSGGFYFGKLSAATATGLPITTRGTFDPVIEFGLGLQMGLGYSIDKGILSAGFSVTFLGIIQGVIAPWHPYDGVSTGTDVQSDNYFCLTGQFGIQGKLYGTVNFAIISASVSVSVQLVAQIIYQAYRAIPISISASVSVSVRVKIDLGLFSFHISFSFATTITEDMTIGQDQAAPWEGGGVQADNALRLGISQPRRLSRRSGRMTQLFRNRSVSLSFSPFLSTSNGVSNAALPTLTIVLTPQFTVLSPDVNKVELSAQQGAFVALFSMDAPTADGIGNANASSFTSLCNALLPWVIAGHPDTASADRGVQAMDSEPIPVETLQEILKALADPAAQPTLSTADILTFLQTSFLVNIVIVPDSDQQAALQAGAVIFPAVPGLSLTVPDPTNSAATVTIDLANWTQVTPNYRTAVIAAFNQVAANINNEINPPDTSTQKVQGGDLPESLTQILFEDSFGMISRQLIQAAIDAYDSYPYALQPGDTLQSIMDFAQINGKDNPVFTFTDLVNANIQALLSASKPLAFPGISYTVQTSDSLNAIAVRYTDNAAIALYSTTPAALIMGNSSATNLLQPGVTVSVGTATVITQTGDSFDSVALVLGITVTVLSEQVSLYPLTNLLLPSIALAIPAIVYQTADGDTLGGLLAKFNTTADFFVGYQPNLVVTDIFNRTDEALVHLSNLELLTGSQLSQAIATGETIGQTAGMVSRFMLQGLRLPNASGLSLPSAFLYPKTGQPDYGLYQLTGQQFPVTDYTTTKYQVTLTKDQATLAWIEINGSAATASGIIDLTAAGKNLKVVLDWAVSFGYNPNAPTIDPPLTLTIEPAVTLTPMQFATAGYTPWSTSGMGGIETITGVTNGSTGQVQPILWQLPPALLSQIEIQQGALEQDMALEAALPYLPVFSVATLTSDPATRASALETVSQFSFATRLDFQIRQLSQAAGSQTQTANSNTVIPYGDGNTPPVTDLAPNSYQLIGPSPSDAQLLQRILTQMEALGQNCVTGLLLGYTNPGGGQNGLVGHSSGDVYSFITRSNLSTQGNPPASTMALMQNLGASAVPGAINDAVNDIEDFIRMLWELSAVQSGGYTFYWDGLINGADLPSGLFDSSGYATLTLLVTYAHPATLVPGARFTDCCNAVLTSSAIDTARSSLVLVSQSSRNSAKVLASDNLALLAARYSMAPGTLAAANPLTPLSMGSQFTLNALYHQISLADMLTQDAWATIAAYYSVNATTRLSAQALQAYNPGVTAATGAVVLIPATQYVVHNGDTLSSIATYFKLRVEVVGASAKAVVGLFVAGQDITVDSQSYSATPALGTGNVGMDLTRANLEPSGDATTADYGKDYMFTLYSLLDMTLSKNAFFKESTPSSPFGPTAPAAESTDSPAELQTSAKHIARLRHPASRRAFLVAQAALPLSYSQALSIYVGDGPNAAPTNPAPYLPAAAANPYIGVGAIAQLRLRWLDIFGNLTTTPFNNPQLGYNGPLNNPPVPVLYTDMLIGLSQWPNVSATYIYSGEAGSPQLQITFMLNTIPYLPTGTTPAPAAVTDATVFNNVYFQVNQNYDGLGIPGLSGPAVTFSLANTLTGGSAQVLDAANTALLIDFINACTATVNAAAKGIAPTQQPTAALTLALPLASVVSNNVVRLRLTLLQNRLPSLVDASLLDVPGGVSVSAEIPAYTATGKDISDALLSFAHQMEVAFLTQDWQYRVGTGPGDPDVALSDKAYTIWAVRFARNGSNQGMAFTIGDAPVFFAPKPVAKCLYSGSVVLPVYQTGTDLRHPSTPTTTYTGVDLNLWVSQALGLIDTFLAAAYAAPTFILDEMLGVNPDESGMLFQILSLKSALADTIADTVRPVFADDAPDTTMTAAAVEALKQSLLLQLGNASTVNAVAVVPVSNATTNEALPKENASPPAFYGQPINKATPQGSAQNYALSSGIVPLNANGSNSTASSLAFLFTCANPHLQPSIQLELTYQLTHLQNAITAIDGIDGYRQSTWINFVTGPVSCPIGDNPIDFPVVLRALPLPPTAQAQSGSSSGLLQLTPAQLCEWDYSFTFGANQTAQDSLRATVAFNTKAVAPLSDGAQTTPLFAALAAIISCSPTIFNDFDLYLRKVDHNTLKASSVFTNARSAVQAWVSLITAFSAAYTQWANPSAYFSSFAVQAGLPPVVLNFQIELNEATPGDAVIEVITLDGPSTPIPKIWIGSHKPEDITPPTGVLAAYRYPLETGGYLTHAQALNIAAQTVCFTQLDAVSNQSADTAIEIQRNLDLVEGKTTNGDFIFSTAPVSFGSPMVPLIANVGFDLTKLDPQPTSPASLATYLTEFFSQLTGDQGAQWVTAQIQASANYPMNQTPGSPIISIPISLLPPITPNSDAINAISNSVTQWLDVNQEALKGIGATLDFNILLYGTLPGSMLALVKIDNVFILIDKVWLPT